MLSSSKDSSLPEKHSSLPEKRPKSTPAQTIPTVKKKAEGKSTDFSSPFLKVPPIGRVNNQPHSYPNVSTRPPLKQSEPIEIPSSRSTTSTNQIRIFLEKPHGTEELVVPRSTTTLFVASPSDQEVRVSFIKRNSEEPQSAIPANEATHYNTLASSGDSEHSANSGDSEPSASFEEILSDENSDDVRIDMESTFNADEFQREVDFAVSFMQKLRDELSRKKESDDKAQTKTSPATEKSSLLQNQVGVDKQDQLSKTASENKLLNENYIEIEENTTSSPSDTHPSIQDESDSSDPDFTSINMETNEVGSGFCQTKVKPVLRGIVSTGTSVPTALNAFANPLGITPDQLSKAVLEAATVGELTQASFEGTASLVMNSIQMDLSLQTVYDDLRKSLPHTFDSPKDAIINLSSILGSTNAAIAAFAIAFGALAVPAGIGAGIGVGVPSIMTTFFTRFLPVTLMLKAFFMFFNDNANLQLDFVDQVKHLDLEEKKVDQLFEYALFKMIVDVLNQDKKGQNILCKLNPQVDDAQPNALLTDEELNYLNEKLQLDDANLETIATHFSRALETLANNSSLSVKEKKWVENLMNASTFVFDLGLGTLSAFGVTPVYLQKGFDGWRILLGYAGVDLNKYPLGAQQGIGAAASAITGIMYFRAGWLFRWTCLQLAKHLQEAWQKDKSKFAKDISIASVITALTALAWSGPRNIAASVTQNINNIAGITPNSRLALAIEILNLIGGGVFVNLGSAIQKYLKVFGFQTDATNLTKEQFFERLNKPSQYVVSPGVAQEFGLFAKAVASKAKVETDINSKQSNYVPPTPYGKV